MEHQRASFGGFADSCPGKKKAKAWNESDAQQFAERASVEIAQNGDGYEIRPME